MNIQSKQLQQTSSPFPLEYLVLSNSTLNTFHSCARKLEIRQFYGQPTVQIKDESYAGEVGKALHCAYGKWMETHNETAAVMELLINFPHELEFLTPSNSQRSLEAAYAALMTLINSPLLQDFEIAQIKIKDGTTRACLEVPFALNITGSPLPIPVYFVGFLDLILFDNKRQEYIVVDLKTTRRLYSEERYQWDAQCIPYSIILQHALNQKIESLNISYLQVFVDLVSPKVQLFNVVKSADDISDFVIGLFDDIERIAKYYKRGHFPRTTDGKICASDYGVCQFYEECSYRDPEMLERILGAQPRKGLFSSDENLKAWVETDLEFVR